MYGSSRYTGVAIVLLGLVAFGAMAKVVNAESLQGFEIVSKKSEVRFFIDELLFGKPKLVVGRTSDIRGSIALDTSGTAPLQWMPIRVDAQDLTTDNSFRNKALRNQILDANKKEFRYIVFKPTLVDGLPDPAAIVVGEPFEFRVTGGLTIRGITRSVTFEMSMTATSTTALEGAGTATITRSDFELWLPKVRNVADVADEIRLEVDVAMVAIGG